MKTELFARSFVTTTIKSCERSGTQRKCCSTCWSSARINRLLPSQEQSASAPSVAAQSGSETQARTRLDSDFGVEHQ